MSLSEVMRGKEPIEAITFSLLEVKKKEAAELEELTRQFLEQGGKITQLRINQAAIDTAKMQLVIDEITGQIDFDRSKKIANQKKCADECQQEFYAGRNRSKDRSEHGQNIKLRKGGYCCEISKFVSPVYPPTEEGRQQAIKWRDETRLKLKMQPAEY